MDCPNNEYEQDVIIQNGKNDVYYPKWEVILGAPTSYMTPASVN